MAPRSPRPSLRGLLLVSAMAFVATLGFAAPARAVPEKAAGGIRFTYTDANAAAVFWAGDFNAWNATANPLVKGAGGVWSVVMPLPAGRHQYKFVVDGQWFADPENGVTAGSFGNSLVEVGANGEIVEQKATSNTAYSPKIFVGGRAIGLYHSVFDPAFSRYELTDPSLDFDLGFDVRISDLLQAKLLTNINPQKEDVQDFRSRLNFKRGSIVFQDPNLRLTAYDSENLPVWDDPMRLVGGIGTFDHPFGFQRQGFVAQTKKLGFDAEVQYSDNFRTGGTEFADFQLNRADNRSFVFDSDPAGKAIALLRTERAGSGFVIPRDQATRVQSTDLGDNDVAFGFGDGGENVFAARLRRALPGSLTMGLLGRTDRGFNLGRLFYGRPAGDSLVRVLSGNYSQEWFAGGIEGAWSPDANRRVFGEYLQGARRYSLVTGSWTDWNVTSIGALGVTATSGASRSADGEHLTVERSWRAKLGGRWSFAKGDVALSGAVEYQNHSYPSWAMSPVLVPGQASDDQQRFENVDYQRVGVLDAADDVDNSAVTLDLAWDRNWRYYLNREVRTRLEVQLVDFEYDRRTSWQHQLWFPTGNFWLESGKHVVTVDRLTVLGTDQVLRLRPSFEVPFWYARHARFAWRGTFSWADSGGADLGRAPRYAESVFQFGVDVTKPLRFTNDTRWVKYDAPDLALDRGYVSQFSELTWSFSPTISVGFGFGVDPDVLDPNTNQYAPIGRTVYLNQRNANGYIAQTNYTSLAPQIAQAERRLQNEKRFQLQAIVHF